MVLIHLFRPGGEWVEFYYLLLYINKSFDIKNQATGLVITTGAGEILE
jgi:hypothetical protein